MYWPLALVLTACSMTCYIDFKQISFKIVCIDDVCAYLLADQLHFSGFFERQKEHIEFRKLLYEVFNVFFPSTVP